MKNGCLGTQSPGLGSEELRREDLGTNHLEKQQNGAVWRLWEENPSRKTKPSSAGKGWGEAGSVLLLPDGFDPPFPLLSSLSQLSPNHFQTKTCPYDRISYLGGSFCPTFPSSLSAKSLHPTGKGPLLWDAPAPPSERGRDPNWQRTLQISGLFLRLSPPFFFSLAKPKRGKKEGEQEQGTKMLQNEGIPNIPQING